MAVMHNGAHLFVISSQHGDSRKQRTGHGGAEQKAIRSTTVHPPRTAARGGGGRRGLLRRRPMRVRECPVVVTRSLREKERRDERKKDEERAIGRRRAREAKCRELPVRKRTFRAVIFISFPRKTPVNARAT